MSLYFAVRDLTSNVAHINPALVEGLEASLLKMIKIGGTFPTALKVIGDLRAESFSEKSSPEKIGRVLMNDPVLVLRVLSIVNSTFYSRGFPITTITGSVNHLGLMKIAEIVADMAEAKNYRALYLGRALSSLALQEVVLSSILARRIAGLVAPREGLEEPACIFSILARLGFMLLAFQKPSLYAACCIDALHSQNSSLEKNFKRLLGKSHADFAGEAAMALALPQSMISNAALVDVAPWNRRGWTAEQGREVRLAVTASFIAGRLASEVTDFSGAAALDVLLKDMADRADIKPDLLKEALGESVGILVDQMHALGMSPVRLPHYVEGYTEPIVERDGTINSRRIKWPNIAERINSFLNELRACFRVTSSSEEFYHLPQTVLCTLRALVHGLNFDFAMFMRFDKREQVLTPAAWVGDRVEDVRELVRKNSEVASKYMPDVQALQLKQTVFTGDPIFEDCWPLMAFPAVARGEVIGVFFAHKNKSADAAPLDYQEQVATIALAEEWHDIPMGFY